MLILGINTATQPQSVILWERKSSAFRVLSEKKWQGSYDESSTVLPNIISILHDAKKSWHDLGAITVVKGPGSFSSIRIGVTIANTLAYALKIPVYGVKNRFTLKEIHFSMKCGVELVTPFYEKEPNITFSIK